MTIMDIFGIATSFAMGILMAWVVMALVAILILRSKKLVKLMTRWFNKLWEDQINSESK